MTAADQRVALRVDSAVKRFGELVAVNGVSLDVAEAELLALVGPSGCGKSTLLRLVAGLMGIESGTIELGGKIVDDGRRPLPPEQRRVGLVFQEHALFPHLTVARNIGFGVTGPKPTRRDRVDEMLELVGLGGYGERYPHELSGGERQRVALARALAPDPAVMLLDEPFASLDPNLRAQIRDDVVTILRGTRTPAVFVTHDQDEALAVGDRVAVMHRGRLAQIDTPETVFHRPTSRFVAAFMGDADFMTTAAARMVFPPEAIPAGLGGDDLVMARPDDVVFTADERGSAVVTQSEFRGSVWCYTLEFDSGQTLRSLRSHLHRVDTGTRVQPSVRPGHRLVHIPGDQDLFSA